MLKGEAEFEEETEEESLFDSEVEAETPKEVNYNPRFPIEDFDFIITDECHRSIYNVWRQVLEYYDTFLIGLTATPSKQTFGFFLTSLAGPLARLDRKLSDNDRTEIQSTAGREFKQIINGLLGAVDPDQQIERAKAQFQTETPTEQQIQQAATQLADDACTPFDNPQLRKLLNDLKTQREQIIDTVSQDQVLSAGFDISAQEKAQTLVESFQQFIEQNKDEITALQIIYNQPYGQRQVTYE
jgi:type I site-specific restriction endonuclease